MSLQEPADTSSLFSMSGVRGRMKEKKHGVLKTAKVNATLASKIKTKTINNSSIIKVTLKQNNKALALALTAAKVAAQRLTDDKMLLQKEVELCHFENACLRQKLSSVNKRVGELQQLMNRHLQAAFKLSRLSENTASSSLLNDEGHCWTDNIAGNQDGVGCLSKAAPKSLRIPLSHVIDEDGEPDRAMGMVGTVTTWPVPPSGVSASGLGGSWNRVPPAAAEKSFPCRKESFASSGDDGHLLSQEDGPALALNLSTVLADNLLLNAPPQSRSCSLSALGQGSPIQQDKDVTRPCSDSVVLSHGHVTKRRKRRTGASDTSGGSDYQVELSDHGLLGGPQGTVETEPDLKENLEVSQVGELLTLSSKNKSHKKIKALTKASLGAKDRESSANQQKRNVDSCNKAPRLSEADSLKSSKTKPESACSAEDSSQNDRGEETVPGARCSRKGEHRSRPFDKTTGGRRSAVVDPRRGNDCNPWRTFLEKKKNLEIHFQNPEPSTASNQIRQDEEVNEARGVKRSNKTGGSRRTYVVEPGPPPGQSDGSPSGPEAERNKLFEDLEDLSSLFPTPRSGFLNSKAPLHAFSPLQVADIQTQVPSQETTGLNVKRIKPKRKTQEFDGVHRLSEAEGQGFEVNMHPQTQPEETKTKKGHQSKAAKTAKGTAEGEQGRAGVELFDPMEDASRVKKRKKHWRDSAASTRPTSASSLESMPPTPLVAMDDEEDPLDALVRNATRIPRKVQRSSGTQGSRSLNKTTSCSSQKVCLGASGREADVKKRAEAKSKLNKRTTYTVRNVAEGSVASNSSLPNPEGGKHPTSASALESTPPTPLVAMDDEEHPLDALVRNATRIPQKVPRSSGTQGSRSPNKTTSSSSQKVCLGASGREADVKKRAEAKSKLSKRTTYTVRNVAEGSVASNSSLPNPEGGKASQGDRSGWSFLQLPASRTPREVLADNVTETRPQFESLAIGSPKRPSVDCSKTLVPDSSPFGHSPGDAENNVNPGRNSAFSQSSTIFNKNYIKQAGCGRGQRKTVLATPEMALQDPAPQGNENQALKDVTNVSSHSYSSFSPETSPIRPSRRRNKGVSYAEPKLNSKLRRGDPHTVSDFLRSPIFKTKRKKMTKTSEMSRKSKKIKREELQPTTDFMALA